ncbi:hypothetical protein P389DRAFT_170898 [Cystobasidium minutum MCA 4210]|uniref:uncharacterized protein n=1 Tax=Cystobasidium minutum MCA 4210 TaxID=1397322 RepID=UPI0034CDFF44|eukprot:jgi/Rhomi1/170898/fgenesh1_kg.4_\
MAPSSSAVHIRLAEPVVFLRNLDSATDRRERRAQRRRAQQAADALLRAEGHPSHTQDPNAAQHSSGSLFRHPDQSNYIPPSGRGGAGSRSRDRSGSQIRGASLTRGGSAQQGASPSRLPSFNHPLSSSNNNEEASADLQRGRSPAPRRGGGTASPRELTRTATPPQPPVAPTYVATPNVDAVALPPPPLPLVDVPIVQPESADIGLTRPPAIIRGVMTVHFSKPTRVKKIGIRLKGQSKTEWPEGLGPRRLDTAERNTLIDETVYFFDATSSSAAQSRRTASIGPGSAMAHRDSSITPEAFEHGARAILASSASRSASMMPATRQYQASSTTVRQAAAGSSSALPRAASVDSQRVSTPEEVPHITGAPLPESPPSTDPPQYSTSSRPDPTTGASTTVASAPRSPTPDSRIPHEHFSNRAAELRAEAAAMSPPSNPLAELSPSASRASSLYGRTTATTAAVHGSSTDNSRPGSVASNEIGDAALPSASRHSIASAETIADVPASSTEAALTPLETSASRMSISSSSDHEAASSLEEHRGRSQMPVNRGVRGSEVLTNQTIMEDGPQEAYLDSLPEHHEHDSPSTFLPSRPHLSVHTSRSPNTAPPADYASGPSADSQSSLSARPTSSIPSGSSQPSSARRSSSVASSHTLSSHTPKSTRFSLSNLMHRDKSSSRTRRSASPESMQNSRRNASTSRTRGNGLQAIKNALIGHHDKDSQMVTTQVTQTPLSSEAESDSEDEHNGRGRSRSASRSAKWQEFKAGSYNFPIYFPIPLSLPPTIHANHGQVTYMLKGFVNRAGALTTNLHAVSEVHVVAAPHEDDLEAIESIIVERMWETQLNYKIVIHCKSAPIGGQIPITIRLNPLAKMKLFRLTAVLEEKFTIYAKDRKMARSEPIRRYDLIKVQKPDSSAMLPIISEDPDAIAHSPLKDWIHGYTTTDGEGIQTMDPNGPWILENSIPVPDCSSALSFSTSHEKANISVIHSLKIIMRVERGDDDYLDSKGDRKKFDIIVEAPMHILSCRTAAVNALPTYTTNPSPITNPFDADGEISIDSSAFHPHELSDTERHMLHYRAGSHLPVVSHRNGHHQRHGINSMTAAATGVSDSQLQAALLQGSGADAGGDPPPPAYEYVETHPDEGTSPPILAIAV